MSQAGIPRNGTNTGASSEVPLCVDLDGTLTYSDLSWLAVLQLLKNDRLALIRLVGWLTNGLAFLKRQIATQTKLDMKEVPWFTEFIDFLENEKKRGRKLVLCTAADYNLAKDVAAHWGLFDEVIASDGFTNLRGRSKAKTLVRRFGEKAFDYAGNSLVDLPVWAKSRQAIVVNAHPFLAKLAAKRVPVAAYFPRKTSFRSILSQAVDKATVLQSLLFFAPALAFNPMYKLGTLLMGFFATFITITASRLAQMHLATPSHSASKHWQSLSPCLCIGLATGLFTISLIIAAVIKSALILPLLLIVLTGVAGALYLQESFPSNLLVLPIQTTAVIICGDIVVEAGMVMKLVPIWFFIALTFQCLTPQIHGLVQESSETHPQIPYYLAITTALITIALVFLQARNTASVILGLLFAYWILRLVRKTYALASNPWELITRDSELIIVQLALLLVYLYT